MTHSVNTTDQWLSKPDLTGKTAFDSNSLNNLKVAAQDNSPAAIKAVAQQFEAVFMNMMLKSMREATSQDSPFDNEQSRTFTSMLDQQLSQVLATKGLGLSDILAKQLSKTSGISALQTDPRKLSTRGFSTETPQLQSNVTQSYINANTNYNLQNNDAMTGLHQHIIAPLNAAITDIKSAAQEYAAVIGTAVNNIATAFQAQMAAHAEAASKLTGLPASFMIGQAALETGWGKREIKGADGTTSNNLFGIKANSSWQGKVVEAVTTEYVNGSKQKRIEKFRAYDSFADSFKDFANLMQKNPRYQNVMANLNSVSAYAQAMQKAGYATDPNYANKLENVIRKLAQP